MNTTKIIAWLTAITVAIIAVLSFTLSYAALYEMALSNGYPAVLAYIWPLLIDAPLVVFSLATVNAYLHNESTTKQWSLVGIYTLLTIFFNALHAPTIGDVIPVSVAPILPLIVAIIAPVSLFFSFEMLMQQLKNSVKRSELYSSIKKLEEKLSVKLQEFNEAVKQAQEDYNQKVENYNRDYSSIIADKENAIAELDSVMASKSQLVDSKKTELDVLQCAIEKLEMSDVDKRRADMLQKMKYEQVFDAKVLADMYGVSTPTIYADWREMVKRGLLERDENNNLQLVSQNGVE